MSRDSTAVDIKRTLGVPYASALRLARSARPPKLTRHPLARFAPEPISRDWLWEVSRFAEACEHLLDQMRHAHPGETLTTLIAIEELEKGWGSRFDRDYLAACHDSFFIEIYEFDQWWEYIDPHLDLVEPLRSALALRGWEAQ